MADPNETQHNLKESADKIRISTDLTRGTDTRNQEKHKLKVRAETPEQAAADLDTLISELEERSVFDRARQIQNDDSE